MWKTKLLSGALLAASIVFVPAIASAEVGIFVDLAPPAPRYEVVPAPRAGFIWAPGYWDWRKGHHYWNKGHWERERRGYHWNESRWEQRDGRWTLNRGGWERMAEERREHDRR